MELLCPLCGERLEKAERQYICPNRHSFDIARQGYVHLLPVQNKRSLAPGDTREQVLSRRAFLEEGHYAPIAAALFRSEEHRVGKAWRFYNILNLCSRHINHESTR